MQETPLDEEIATEKSFAMLEQVNGVEVDSALAFAATTALWELLEPPQPNTTWHLLKADVTKAHRLMRSPPEWKYQIAQIDGDRWVNMVGSYGMTSAQLTGGALLSSYLGFATMSFLRLIGASSLWMTFSGSSVDDLSPAFVLAVGCPLPSQRSTSG